MKTWTIFLIGVLVGAVAAGEISRARTRRAIEQQVIPACVKACGERINELGCGR